MKGGPIGSMATIAFTSEGRASPKFHPYWPDCEWVSTIAGYGESYLGDSCEKNCKPRTPILSNNATPALCTFWEASSFEERKGRIDA